MAEVKYNLGNGQEISVEYDEYDQVKITRECFEMLIEKQIPKKPMLMKFDHYDSYFCKCGLGFGNSIMMIRPNYCERCGQKLDWGNENDRAD